MFSLIVYMGYLFGSICLSDIPRDQIRRVVTKDGREKLYVSVQIYERRVPRLMGGRSYTHFVSCAPARAMRRAGVNYIFGDLCKGDSHSSAYAPPSPEKIAGSPSIGKSDVSEELDNLPF